MRPTPDVAGQDLFDSYFGLRSTTGQETGFHKIGLFADEADVEHGPASITRRQGGEQTRISPIHPSLAPASQSKTKIVPFSTTTG